MGLEENPMIQRLFDDSEMLDRMRNMLLNPSLAQEMRRQQDLAVSNLNAVQGGEEMLQQVMEPLQAALGRAFQNQSGSMSSSSQSQASADNHPLTNPWATGEQATPTEQTSAREVDPAS